MLQELRNPQDLEEWLAYLFENFLDLKTRVIRRLYGSLRRAIALVITQLREIGYHEN